jgi:hypothetical protein
MKLTELQETKKGTYAGVRFSEQTKHNIRTYIADNRIPRPLSVSKLHTTLLYSRKYCPDYEPLGMLDKPIIAKPAEWDVFMTRPTKGEPTRCLVLKLFCPDLVARHMNLMGELQAEYDFLEYTPHISLSYNIGDYDINTLPPVDFDIEIVEEYGKDLDLDWGTKNG